jgi:hypothetical protein
MDENQTVDRVLATIETSVEPAVPEQVPVPAVPKRKYTHRADGQAVRQQIVGYLSVCLLPGEALSAGQLAEVLGCDALVAGYHCRALAAAGKITAVGEKRGRKYSSVVS